MSNPNEMAVESVDGSSFSEDEYELAIENGIEVTGYNSDVPVGESVEEVVEDYDEELEIDESNEPEGQEATSEVDEDPFGSPSVKSGEQVEIEDEDDEFKDLPKGFKKSLKRKARQVGRLERELAEVKALLAQGQPQQQEQLPFNESQFANRSEYETYKRAYMAAQDAGKVQQQQAAIAQRNQELASTWQEKVVKSYASEDEQADYFESIQALGNPEQHFSKEVLEYMFQSDVGPKMLHYFAERPQAINQLKNMHPYDVPSVLTKVQQFVSKPVQNSVHKESKAPTPMGSLTNKSTGTVKSIDKMSDEELLKAYQNGTLKF